MSTVDTVPLANARAEIASLERSNAAIEQTLRSRDVIYSALTARDGHKLAALFERMVKPLVFGRLEQHRQLLVAAKVLTPDRVLTDAQLETIESVVREHSATSANDDASRCMKQMLMLFALVREPTFRFSLLRQPPPAHPYPDSAEARAAAATAPRLPLVAPVAFVSWLQEDLLPAYTAIMTGDAKRIVLEDWIAARTVAYMARLPLDAARQ